MTYRWLVGLMAVATPLVAHGADPVMLSDPYAKDPHSTLSSWPPLYHLPPGHKPYFYLMGWCGVQHHGKRYDDWYRSHAMLDINALPETSWEGEIVSVAGSLLTAREPGGDSVVVACHSSPAVTALHMVGAANPESLARGVWVRFVGMADHEGHVAAPVSQIEVYTPRPDDQLPQVVPDQVQVIAGRIVAGNKKTWDSKPATRSRFNAVRFALADDARLVFDVARIELAKPGQKVTIRGRLFDVAAQLKEREKLTEPGYFQQTGEEEIATQSSTTPTLPADDPSVRSLRPVIFACRATIELSPRPNPPVARNPAATTASKSAAK